MAADLRRLGLASSPSLHVHHVLLDGNMNGRTTVDAYHDHDVVGGVVMPRDGHTHALPTEMLESSGARQLNDAVSLVGAREATPLREAKVDSATRVIENVLMLGGRSPNGGQAGGKGYSSRVYTREAQQSAVPLFEGTRAYLNHITESEQRERNGNRNVRDFLGVYRNVRHLEAVDEVRGDLHVVKGDHGDTVLDTAERFPEALGLSVDAEGHGYIDDSRGTPVLMVEGFTAAHSCDLVDRPATTVNLFESDQRLREHYARGRLFNPSDEETPAMKPGTTQTPATGDDTELREQLKTEKAAREAAEAKLREHDEAAKAAEKVAATQAIVARVLESKGKLPEKVAARVRERFKATEATEADVTAFVDAEVAYLREMLEASGGSTDELGIAAVDVRESANGGARPDTGEATVKLAESAFGRMCGADFNEKPKS